MDKPVLTITLDDGGVHVEGPINDKMLCYALLEHARDAIKDFNDAQRQPQSKIAAPSPSDIALASRRVQ